MKSTQNKTPLQLTSDLKTKQAFNSKSLISTMASCD